MHNNISFVTGIWDLGRDSAASGWNRTFQHYIDNFIRLLTEMKDYNLIVFIDPSIEHIVWEHRDRKNTVVYHHSKDKFNGNFFPFFDQVQKIRNDPQWYGQAGWLKDSTQGSLEYYNPMVMSKMFLLNNARLFNPFSSDYYYWIDGGITNTLSLGYFNNSVVINNLINLSKKFLFICFPYETNSEIHGFNIEAMKKFSNSDTVNRVARGGFFGGHKNYIHQANGLYYQLLHNSLHEGFMGTEESIFTIMTYLQPETYHHEMINGDGLVYTFFEKLQEKAYIANNSKGVNLYINTFQSPSQLQMLLDSFEKYESSLLQNTNKILINNTPDIDKNIELFKHYDNICAKYQFTQIKNGNMGICGSRQWCAEHFQDSDAEYMLFFEDDMLLDFNGNCPFGFNKNVENLLETIIEIMNKEKYDFLKLSFSEFYGHNGDQWSWHNVPQNQKIQYFGELLNRPPTKFNNIKSLNNTPYADGEIYYSNWPHIISKEGNKRCFLDTKWAHPFEQTWMSHLYTLAHNSIIRSAILLASPITHNREHHYLASERKEN
jgi:hypothetical protein